VSGEKVADSGRPIAMSAADLAMVSLAERRSRELPTPLLERELVESGLPDDARGGPLTLASMRTLLPGSFGTTWFIEGDAGMGKSTTLRTLEAQLLSDLTPVLYLNAAMLRSLPLESLLDMRQVVRSLRPVQFR